MEKILLLLIFLGFYAASTAQTPEISLTKDLKITTSCRIKPDTYQLPADSTAQIAVCTIEGENIEVDFQQAQLRGAVEGTMPDGFYGYALIVRGYNIVLKNARAQGYKVALYADSVENLTLENCDFSYNYRSRLSQVRTHDLLDSLENHPRKDLFLSDQENQWLEQSAGILLNSCTGFVVRDCRITGNENALVLSSCRDGVIYNNLFQFNSGVGIALSRSTHTKIMHNLLDWNVRGSSYESQGLGKKSFGIRLYERSSDNVVAYNSATHCGTGFIHLEYENISYPNIIFGNDFSHSATDGVRIVSSSYDRIQGNILRDCINGISGLQMNDSYILGNYLADCETGINMKFSWADTIRQNLFQNNDIGIRIWLDSIYKWVDRPGTVVAGCQGRRAYQPEHTRNYDHSIDRNVFLSVRNPLNINASKRTSINGENLFSDFETLLETSKPNDSLQFLRNDIYGTADQIESVWKHPELAASRGLNFGHLGKPENPYAPLDIPYGELHEPDSLPGGMLAVLPDGFPRGRRFILVDEWGPFDFRRPIATVDTVAGQLYSLVLVGPPGDWKITEMKGVKTVSARKGTVPTQLSFQRDPAAKTCSIQFEYSGRQTIVTQFGKKIPPGELYRFTFME